MPLVHANSTTLPAYLTSPGQGAFNAGNPGIFPLGVPIDRDLYIADQASACTFATGTISLQPEQISGGADNLAGTTVVLNTSSCPEMRAFTLANLQGSVNSNRDFRTASLCTATAITCGYEPRAMIEDNSNFNGFTVKSTRVTNYIPAAGSVAFESSYDWLGGNGGSVPSWQTQPVSVGGMAYIPFSPTSALCTITVSVVATWASVDSVTGLLVLSENKSDTVFLAGATAAVASVQINEAILPNPTWLPSGGGYPSVLINLRIAATIVNGTFRNQASSSTMTTTFYGRQTANLENVTILAIVGGYEGRSMLNFSMHYEVQPSRETMPLVRGAQRRAHTSAERDNFLTVRDALWGMSSSYLLLSNASSLSDYIAALTDGRALEVAYGENDMASFPESPMNGTLTPRYSASAFGDAWNTVKRAGKTGLGSFLRSLADSKTFRASPAYRGSTNSAQYRSFLASGKENDWSRNFSPSLSEDQDMFSSRMATNSEKKNSDQPTQQATEEKAIMARLATATTVVPQNTKHYRAMDDALALEATSSVSTKRRRPDDMISGEEKFVMILNPARLNIEPGNVNLRERKVTVRPFEDAKRVPGYNASGENIEPMVLEQPEDVASLSSIAEVKAEQKAMQDHEGNDGISPMQNIREAGYIPSTWKGAYDAKSDLFFASIDATNQAQLCRNPGHTCLHGDSTLGYQLFTSPTVDAGPISMSLMSMLITVQPLHHTTGGRPQRYNPVEVRGNNRINVLHVGAEFSDRTAIYIKDRLESLMDFRPPPIGISYYVSARGFDSYDIGIVDGPSLGLALGLAYCGAPTVVSTGSLDENLNVGAVGDLPQKLTAMSVKGGSPAESGWQLPFIYPANPSITGVPGRIRGVTDLFSALDFCYAYWGTTAPINLSAESQFTARAALKSNAASIKRYALQNANQYVNDHYDRIIGDDRVIRLRHAQNLSSFISLGETRKTGVNTLADVKEAVARSNVVSKEKEEKDRKAAAVRAAQDEVAAEYEQKYRGSGFTAVERVLPKNGQMDSSYKKDADKEWAKFTSGKSDIPGVSMSIAERKPYQSASKGSGLARYTLAASTGGSIKFGVVIGVAGKGNPDYEPGSRITNVTFWTIPKLVPAREGRKALAQPKRTTNVAPIAPRPAFTSQDFADWLKLDTEE